MQSIDDSDKPTVPVTIMLGAVLLTGMVILALAVVGAVELWRAWL